MSDSRLEKFIYAICSMDVNDLPVPLSRIEKLWNCLITGETPDFEPLSRNEKYLMAMLDRYDISNLPAPMSRGEKLLYKIAVGETDLSDVPGYLSRYEELLKYLIENGGISGGDFEYVLYTLNQSLYTLYTTAEKPVKSAILLGQTLVNLVKQDEAKTVYITREAITNGFRYTQTYNSTSMGATRIQWDKKTGANLFKPSSKYYIQCDIKVNKPRVLRVFSSNRKGTTFSYTFSENESTRIKGTFVSDTEAFDYIYLYISPLESSNMEDYIDDTFEVVNLIIVEYQEGMENWDIPYFEGMQSVKMPVLTTTGKNLFDINHFSKLENWDEKTTSERPYCAYEMKLKPNTSYTFSRKENSTAINTYFCISKKQGVYEWSGGIIHPTDASATHQQRTITTDSTGILYFNLYQARSELANLIPLLEDTQLEEGSVATSYEPYKSNILTTNEDIELRGIGQGSNRVEDELDCLTGEVTERIGKVVLNGSENWNIWIGDDSFLVFTLPKSFIDFGSYKNVICAKYPIKNSVYSEKEECIGINNDKTLHLQIRLLKTKATTTTEFKTWLSQNPITLQYPLATESIKTVDLTTVDQDNQPTQLGTFENVTHVALEAENLIPEVEMEVATNLLEDTVFNLTNAFNTLYPTAAKPVKSAILKGQTLVNVANGGESIPLLDGNRSNSIATLYPLKTNTKMLIKFNSDVALSSGFCTLYFTDVNENNIFSKNSNIINGNNSFIFTTPLEDVVYNFKIYTNLTGIADSALISNLQIFEYQDGMENWDIPYFEGMQSVKMPVLTTTGKNMFDSNNTMDGYGFSGAEVIDKDTWFISDYIEVKPNLSYIISASDDSVIGKRINFYDKNKNFVESGVSVNLIISVPNNNKIFYMRTNAYLSIKSSYQIEQGTVATPYEPYKSNILTVNEEVELRGIDEVKDELNLITGELTQRIGEVVYTEKESWYHYLANDFDNSALFSCTSLKIGDTGDSSMKTNFISDRFTPSIRIYQNDIIGSYIQNGSLFIRVKKEWLTTPDVYGLQRYLQQNPITVQYPLKEEVIKTVDLTVVNKDGNETKLRTFDDTTHVLLHSEAGPNPGAVLTVRTKIPSASSTSLLMDDISTEQQQLNTTVNEQSNNVDATMVATTEIFEETL